MNIYTVRLSIRDEDFQIEFVSEHNALLICKALSYTGNEPYVTMRRKSCDSILIKAYADAIVRVSLNRLVHLCEALHGHEETALNPIKRVTDSWGSDMAYELIANSILASSVRDNDVSTSIMRRIMQSFNGDDSVSNEIARFKIEPVRA